MRRRHRDIPPWSWVGIVGTGQSLAVGGGAGPPVDPAPPASEVAGAGPSRLGNLMLSLGAAAVPPFDPAAAGLTIVPLAEPLRPLATAFPGAYPRNIFGATSHTAMADQISTLVRAAAGRDYVTVHTEVGEAGQPFSVIGKDAAATGATGRAYAASLFEVAALARLARAAGKSYGLGAIVIAHGESDAASATYQDDLGRLWADYNQDLPPLTGQATPIPMLVSQQQSCPTADGSRSPATLAQWRLALDHPGDIVCSGPKYQYPYLGDALHLTAAGYQRLGEKNGQVFVERMVLKRDWRPLQPTAVARSGRDVTVRFHVPVPPLAWDEAMPPPHQVARVEWARGRGFEVRSGNARVPIAGVAIAGDAVRITCDADLPARGLAVAYALTAGTPRTGGTARWGSLRDSDPFVGCWSGVAQPNYCVTFELDVP